MLVALAELGWFRGALAGATLGLTGVLSWCCWQPAVRLTRLRTCLKDWSAWGAGAVLLLGGLLIAPGSEHVVGPRDPGVYLATAAGLSRHGGLIYVDPPLRLLGETIGSAASDTWVYRHFANDAPLRYPAPYFIRDVASGTVEGGFVPGLVVWLAVAFLLGGLEPTLHVSGGFGLVGLGFAMLTWRAAPRGSYGSRAAPLLTGLLLATSFGQVWWAREMMAESALGAFAWIGAWALTRWRAVPDVRWAVLGSLAGVAALFTRADGVLIAGALGVALVLGAVQRRPGARRGVAALGIGGGWFILHALLVAPIYLGLTYGFLTFGRALAGVALLGVGATLAAAAVHFRDRLVDPGRFAVLIGAVALVGVLGLRGVGPVAWLPGYMPWPFLALAGAGLAALIWGRGTTRMLPALLVGGLPALFYLPDTLATADHPWMVRRLAPVVLPLLAMLASFGTVAVFQTARRRSVGPVLACGLLGLGLGLGVIQMQAMIGMPRHGDGVLRGLNELAMLVPIDAVVVFPASEAARHLAMPLDAVHGIATLAIPQTTLSPEVASVLQEWQARGVAVYVATDRPLEPPPGTALTLVGQRTVRWSTADGGTAPPPLRLQPRDLVVWLYHLTQGLPYGLTVPGEPP